MKLSYMQRLAVTKMTMLRSKSKFLTFNSGLADCYEVTDRKIKALKQEQIHYAQMSVGERRYWDAYVSGIQIAAAIRVPIGTAVEQGDLLVIEGKQFVVVQKDYKDDKLPASWLLSLQASPIVFKNA